MTSRDDFDRSLAAWLSDSAPTSEPEHLLGQVLARTARTRRRPAWRILERWIPMSTISTSAATASRVPWRTVGLVALLILALAVGAAIVIGSRQKALPAPFGVAGNGVILSVTDGNIVARDTVDGPARTLVDVEAVALGPLPTPDGTRFSYFTINPDETVDVWTANIDGSGQRRIGGPFRTAEWVAWSPSGDALAVGETPATGNSYVALVPAAGGATTTLDVGIPAAAPQWRAPDGHQILFRSPNGSSTGLFLVDRDGKNLTQLELDPDVGAGGLVDDSYFNAPSLSSDGSRLVYYSRAGVSAVAQGDGLQVHVATLAPDGHVLDDRTLPHDQGFADYAPTFLPDGERILFSRNKPGDVQSAVVADVTDLAAPVREVWCCLGPDDPRDLGIAVAPDGASILTWEWHKPDIPVTSLDLATGTVTESELTTEDNAAWQRIAMPPGS
jgi:Tol biopolymer transport system component